MILDINNYQRQGHNGTASISGHFIDLSGYILRINEKALYTHCHSHESNLVVAASCSVQYVRNLLDQIKEILFFFNLSNPLQKMLGLSTENHAPDCLKKKLENIFCTRWVEQATGLNDFEDLYISIVFYFESISVNEGKVSNRETSTNASSFYKLIASL